MFSRRRRWRRLFMFLCPAFAALIAAAIGLPFLIFRPLPTHLPALSDNAGTLIWHPCREVSWVTRLAAPRREARSGTAYSQPRSAARRG